MDKESVQDFTLRISQAAECGLIVILYDIILLDIKEAEAYLLSEKQDAFVKELKHAGRAVNELMSALNYEIPISRDLLSLYSYVNKSLIKAYMRKTAEPLEAVKKVIQGLRQAFAQIDAKAAQRPVMENVQKVYAGLTYGKGSLNEQILEQGGENRGYLA